MRRHGAQIVAGLRLSENPDIRQIPDERIANTRTNFKFDKMKFLKTGRVAIITRGRYAGKKVVIIKVLEDGTKSHPFGHALVAGIERYPLKVTKRMSKKRVTKRSKVKPFIKRVNFNHIMPTRYTLELESLKNVISSDTFTEPSQREESKKVIKKAFEERYTSGKNRWFFQKLRF